MSGINKVILVCRLGKDPELKYFQGGSAVCNFSAATSEQWNDKKTGEKREKVEWHRIVVFGKMAEICCQYLAKGRQVFIEGKLQTRSWEIQGGDKKYITEIVANTVEFMDSKNAAKPANQQHGSPQAPQGNYQQQYGGYQQPQAQTGYQQPQQQSIAGATNTNPEKEDGIPF